MKIIMSLFFMSLTFGLAGCGIAQPPAEFIVTDIEVKREVKSYTQHIETSAIVKTNDSRLRDKNVVVYMKYTDAIGSQSHGSTILMGGVGQFGNFSVAQPDEELHERAFKDFSVTGYVVLQSGKVSVVGAPSVRTEKE